MHPDDWILVVALVIVIGTIIAVNDNYDNTGLAVASHNTYTLTDASTLCPELSFFLSDKDYEQARNTILNCDKLTPPDKKTVLRDLERLEALNR